MTLVSAAPFEPDKSRYNMAAASNILNVVPVADGWAPLPAPVDQNPLIEVLVDELGNALLDEDGNVLVDLIDGSLGPNDYLYLPETSRGGLFIRLEDGSTRVIVGTETKLFAFNFTGNYWTDISGSSAPYATNDRWSFALYGTTVYAVNGSDPEQMFDLTSDTVFSDNATAPIATDIAVVADFVMRALPDNSVQWSSLDDPTANAIGIRFSDVQPFGDGNGIQRIIPISSGALVIQRDKFEIMAYPDPEYVFRRSPVNGYRGSPAKWSARSIGQDDFVVYCQDGFFRGLNMQPIGAERVDRYILEVCDEAGRQAMTSAADFRRKIVWFRVQKTDSTYLLLGYHWQLDRWCVSDADLSDMFGVETQGLLIGNLESLYPTIADLENLTWGSSILDGGTLEFGGVTPEGYLAYFNGPNMAALVETNEASFNDTSRAIVNGGRVSGDIVNYTATLSTADYKGATFVDRNPVSPSTRTGFVPFRGDGRLHKVAISIPEGESWTTIQGIDLDMTGTGKS